MKTNRDLQDYRDCSGAELGFEKTAPSPLEPKKLNFYCTLGLEGGFKRHGFAAEFASYDIDNQLLRRVMVAVKSINKNNRYNDKNFEFYLKISKKGVVFSKNFEGFRRNFEFFRMDFERPVADGNAKCKENVVFKRFFIG